MYAASQAVTDLRPFGLSPRRLARMPRHMVLADLPTQVGGFERVKLMFLDKRDDRRCTSVTVGIEVDVEITSPTTGHRIRLMSAGTEGDADQALLSFA